MSTHNLCFEQYLQVEKVILTTVNQIFTRSIVNATDLD